MTKPIYPCLWFDGQAKEAALFYSTIFKNFSLMSENPMVVIFEINGKKIMALNGGPQFKINPSISFFINCSTEAEVEQIWNALLSGGKAMMPLGNYAWSKKYGWVQDKFGMTWQIMVSQQPLTQQTLTPSLLFTSNQFGKAEMALNFYTKLFENSAITTNMPYPKEDTNAGKVLYSEFQLNKYPLIAMDGPGVHEYSFNEAVSFVVECETQQEIDYFWDAFTKEGEESMCGWCRDQFGIFWQVVPAILGKLMSDPDKSQRVMQAFLKMKKFNIETLVNA
jgi:predicted 3-demethylubiquinone-9 3-methyltransferase (glyoxalase superfamily)